jgi:dienelactone hydrolase
MIRIKRRFAMAVFGAALLSAAPTHAIAELTIAKESVSFASATLIDPETTVKGELRLPGGTGEKLPAVVVIHNSGGLVDRTGVFYIEALNQAGIATLELDLFPRGGRPASTRMNLPHTYGSLIYLSNHPRIDPARIGVTGFSWGGLLSLLSASTELTDAYVGSKYRFAAHLPLYPVCWAHSNILDGKNAQYRPSIYQSVTGSPVHILVGEKDNYEDPDSCPKFIQSLPEAVRNHVRVTVYPGVGHGWDTQEDRSYRDAAAYKGRGGTVSHYRNSEAAEKSRAFALDFFKSMGSK